jgi:hypothetical protein
MGQNLTTNGQEQLARDSLDGATVQVGLYNDGTDAVTVGGTLADITTEPSAARESSTLTISVSGNFVDIDGSTVTFDVTGSSQTVDSYFFVRDPGTGTELILTGLLQQSRDLGPIDELDVSDIGAEFVAP